MAWFPLFEEREGWGSLAYGSARSGTQGPSTVQIGSLRSPICCARDDNGK